MGLGKVCYVLVSFKDAHLQVIDAANYCVLRLPARESEFVYSNRVPAQCSAQLGR